MTVFTLWPENVQWRRVSPRLFWLEALWLLLLLVLLGGATAVVAVLVGDWTTALPAAIAALVLARLLLLPRTLRAWGYAERDDDLLVRRLSIVPYGRMQFVDVTAGPLERLFGLSTVQLHTAAAASDARIPGLPHAEAARLRDQLTALGEARAAGL